MKHNRPAISCIVPAYNSASTIQRALLSILSQQVDARLKPVDPLLEIIVIDDGSTDNTASVVQTFALTHTQVRLISQDNSGSTAARNHGVRLAEGELIAFLDADDLWLPGKLQQQLIQFAMNPALEICFCHAQNISTDFQNIGEPAAGYISSCMMVTSATLARLGSFNEQEEHSALLEWMIKAREKKIPEYLLSEVLVHRMLCEESLSHQGNQQSLSQHIQVIRQTLQRRKNSMI
ncbi:glycosyltransferase family 2 protein [Magnetococcales bacterium HHB-1]